MDKVYLLKEFVSKDNVRFEPIGIGHVFGSREKAVNYFREKLEKYFVNSEMKVSRAPFNSSVRWTGKSKDSSVTNLCPFIRVELICRPVE